MRTQSQFLDLFKHQKNLNSDYQLAKHWRISTSHIHQYRTGRLRLPMAYILEIAECTQHNPLEIILCLEMHKAKAEHKEKLLEAYWAALFTAIGQRMNINSPLARNSYIYRRFKSSHNS